MLRKKGFTLVEIMIVVAIIGLLAAIAIPNFMGARTSARRQACIANLKQIEGAKQIYALDNNLADDAACAWDNLVPDYIKVQPTCPSSGVYTIGIISATPSCSKAADPDGHALPS